MKRVLYTARERDIDGFADMDYAVYIGPRWRIENVQKQRPSWRYFAMEDLTKREPYLRLHALLAETTPLVLDRVSRYYLVGSETSRRLARLTINKTQVYLLDIVPFCKDIQFLYMPWRYIDRAILGYAHYYAFRENYIEEQQDGTLISAHDFHYLSGKIVPHCLCNRTQAIRKSQAIPVEYCPEEHAAYRARKDELFSTYTTPQPIVTRLADTAHAFASRRKAIVTLLERCPRPVAVVCNLKKYSEVLCSMVAVPVIAATYASVPALFADCQSVVYAEPPIVQSFRFFDIEAALSESCQTYRLMGDSKVDQYLDGELSHELAQVDGFMQTLAQESGYACL